MNDEPYQLEVQPEGDSGPATAGELLALHDQADGLRHRQSAVGVPGLVMFFAMFLYILYAADLGLLATLKASLLVASPGFILIARDLVRARVRARRLQRLEQRIEELEQRRVERREDGHRLPGGTDAPEDGPRRDSG